MSEAGNRMEEFTAEIARMKLKTGRGPVEKGLLVASIVVMVAGVVVAIGAYSASLNVTTTPGSNTDLLNSNSYEMLAIVGLALTVVGGFGFLRYSLAQFLRFWLLRQSYENQAAHAATSAPSSPPVE